MCCRGLAEALTRGPVTDPAQVQRGHLQCRAERLSAEEIAGFLVVSTMQGMFQKLLCFAGKLAAGPARAAFEPEVGGAPDSAVQGQGCAAGEMRDCLQIARADLICRRIARAVTLAAE